jgi:hypothetical protein
VPVWQKAKVKRQKAKVEDGRQRGFHPSMMKSVPPLSLHFCLLPFTFAFTAGAPPLPLPHRFFKMVWRGTCLVFWPYGLWKEVLH